MTVRPLLSYLLLVLLTLSACESALLQEPRVPAAATPVPAAQTTSSDPAEVLREYMTAWNNSDLEAMHGLLAERSRELYPQANFIDKYTVAHSVLRFGGVQYTARGVEHQGTTAVLKYDIAIESPTFGVVVDEDRVMRMVNERRLEDRLVADGYHQRHVEPSPLERASGIPAARQYLRR